MTLQDDNTGATRTYEPPNTDLAEVMSFGPDREKHLADAGYETVGDIRDDNPSRDELTDIDGIGDRYARSIRTVCGLETYVRMGVKSVDEVMSGL